MSCWLEHFRFSPVDCLDGFSSILPSSLKNWIACWWHSDSACSLIWTSPWKSKDAVPANMSSTETCFWHLNRARDFPFLRAHLWYGMHISQRKLLFPIWENWGKMAPSKVRGNALSACLPTRTGGNVKATSALSWLSWKVVFLQRFKMSSLSIPIPSFLLNVAARYSLKLFGFPGKWEGINLSNFLWKRWNNESSSNFWPAEECGNSLESLLLPTCLVTSSSDSLELDPCSKGGFQRILLCSFSHPEVPPFPFAVSLLLSSMYSSLIRSLSSFSSLSTILLWSSGKFFHCFSELLFTDTDSLTYEIKAEDVYSDVWNDKDKFDNSDYSESSPYFDKTNKKVIGKFKGEAAGIPICEFVGLRSKMYSYIKNNQKGGKTGKGIKKNTIKNDIKHENYKDVLFNNNQIYHKMKTIRSNNHQLGSYELNKPGSSLCLTCISTMLPPFGSSGTLWSLACRKCSCCSASQIN